MSAEPPQIRGMNAHQSAAISRWLADCSANIAHYRKKTFWLKLKDTALLLPSLGLGAFIAYECIATDIPLVKVPSLLLLSLMVSSRFLKLSENAYLTELLGKGYSGIVKEYDMTLNAIDLEEGGARGLDPEDIDRLMTRYRGLEAQSIMLPENISGSSATATYERVLAANQPKPEPESSSDDSSDDEEEAPRRRKRRPAKKRATGIAGFLGFGGADGKERKRRPRRRFFRRRREETSDDEAPAPAAAPAAGPDLTALINSAIAANASSGKKLARSSDTSSVF